MASSTSWKKIFDDLNILEHDFRISPFYLTAKQIKSSVQDFTTTGEKEVRILCKQDTRKDRPQVFVDNDLFLLPTKNGAYAIVQGDGYIDIPVIEAEPIEFHSKLEFPLDTSLVGNSEMQHLDYAFATGLLQEFMKDDSLMLTIRGRKYTPPFSFNVNSQLVETASVQTEVDAGYEGIDKVVLIEAKNSATKDTVMIRKCTLFSSSETKERYIIFGNSASMMSMIIIAFA
jgi:hypothetical protein